MTNQDLPPNLLNQPTVIVPDPILSEQRLSYLRDDLSARFDPNAGQKNTKDAFAQVKTSFERRTASTLAATHTLRSKTKTPTERFGPGLNTVFKIQNVCKEVQLPRLYFEVAKAPRGTMRVALEQAYDARVMDPGAATTMVPISTPTFDTAFMRANHGLGST